MNVPTTTPTKEQRRPDGAAFAVEAKAAALFPPLWPDIPEQTATGGTPFLFHVPPAVVLDGSTLSYWRAPHRRGWPSTRSC